MLPTRTPLHQGWTVRPADADTTGAHGAGRVPEQVLAAGAVPATVPGAVHTDLLAAGLVPDPYLDDAERRLAWVGVTGWRYESVLPDGAVDGAVGHERVDLVFEGLDTVASVELGGTVVARTADMHRTHRVDVTDLVRAGARDLAVAFTAPVRAADAASLALGARPHVNPHPYNAIRKMACSFGWDWGPDLATSGIWRPVSLHAWSGARLAGVRPLVDVEGTDGVLDVRVDLERAGATGPLVLTARAGGVSATAQVEAGAVSAAVRLVVPGAPLWWPRGHGAQPLHDVEVVLADPGGDALDTWTGRVGFRAVALRTQPDPDPAAGTSFELVVNGRVVFVKGANWIPDDAFPHRVTRARLDQRLDQAQEVGLNLLRVWGGGVYESDDFYAACDERGIMVWQDFAFACAAYAEEEPLRAEVLAEARDNVTRLAAHPSLVLWNGGNENLWGFVDWGWEARLDGRTWGLGYYEQLLPAVLAELDPSRPYCPGSPWSPPAGVHPNDADHGTMHLWDVWNERDHSAYRDHAPRFASEFGWQGPPAWATLRRAVSDDPLTPESPGMLVHQKAADGNDKLTAGLVPHLRVPDDMDDWHWAMSLNQARAVSTGVEHFRSLAPRCAGSVYWQLNDCWPVTSWSVVDGDGRRKPAAYALARAHADRLVTVQPRGGGLAVVVCDDTDEPWTGQLEVTRRSFAGRVLASAVLDLDVPARGTVALPLPAELATPGEAGAELLVAQVDGDARGRGLWFFSEDRDGALAAPDLEVAARRTADGCAVEVTARALVRDLALLADRVDPGAVVDDMLVTLLPGESVVLTVTCGADVDPEALTDPLVLRSANQLVAPTRGREVSPPAGTVRP